MIVILACFFINYFYIRFISGVQTTFNALSKTPDAIVEYCFKGVQLVKDNIIP